MKWPWTSARYAEALERQIVQLQSAHEMALDRASEELTRSLRENKRLQDELERVRLTLGQPSRMAEPVEEPKPHDPNAMPIFTGSPWERILKREEWLNSQDGKRWQNAQLASLKPESGEKVQSKEN